MRYFQDGTVLKKGIIKPAGEPLSYNQADETIIEAIHDIANGATPIFTYYDTNYDGTTLPIEEPVDILDVRLLKITVLIDKNSSQPPGATSLITQVAMRNLKDNL